MREHRWALLALAQYQTGQQGDALRTLQRARAVLASELGVDPGPDLVALEQAILQQDPALAPVTVASEPSAACPYLGWSTTTSTTPTSSSDATPTWRRACDGSPTSAWSP